MRQKTKQLLCSALVRSEQIANRMAEILSDNDIELLVNGIIVDATIKEDKHDEVELIIKNSRNIKGIVIAKVVGKFQSVNVYYKIINEDGTEGLDVEFKSFNLNINPEYEELFDLQVI